MREYLQYIYIGDGRLGFTSTIRSACAGVYFELGDLKKALIVSRMAIEGKQGNPENAENYVVRGVIYNRIEEFFKSRDDFNKAITLNSRIADAHHSLADIFIKLGQLMEARREVEKAIYLEPDNPRFHKSRAHILLRQAQWNEVRLRSQEQLNHNPHDVIALRNLGCAYYAFGEYGLAAKMLEDSRVWELESDVPEPLLYLGMLYYNSDRREDAINIWARAINIQEKALRYIPDEVREDVRKRARAQGSIIGQALQGIGPALPCL